MEIDQSKKLMSKTLMNGVYDKENKRDIDKIFDDLINKYWPAIEGVGFGENSIDFSHCSLEFIDAFGKFCQQWANTHTKDKELDEFSSVGGGALAGGPQLPLGMSAKSPKKKKKKKLQIYKK